METKHCIRRSFFVAVALAVCNIVFSQSTATDDDALLFYLSGENGVQADYAQGEPSPNFLYNVSSIEDGAVGKGIHCSHKQLFSYWAPGNIYASRGTLSFFWRLTEEFTPTEFPIFRVSYADHTSWDMTWLRIDYNGKGFDAFVTDNHLARIRISHTVEKLPRPDEWTHFALSWDENTGVKFYVNGEKVGQRDTFVVLNTGLDQFGPHSRIISPYQVQSMYNQQLGGDIDELRIYGQALSEKQIAGLAANVYHAVPSMKRDVEDKKVLSAWKRFYGFDKDVPPYLSCPVTTVRKVGILETYDLKRWYWKCTDGIRETTWPGVFNRSSILGRNDYFQIPDWDCYSLSGWEVRFNMPEEPWNYLEVTGGAQGTIGVSEHTDGHDATTVAFRNNQAERSFHWLEQPVTGKTIAFKNEVQEMPLSEFDAFYISQGDAPKGIVSLNYKLEDFKHYDNSHLKEVETYVRNRFQPDERQMLLAVPDRPLPVSSSLQLPKKEKGKNGYVGKKEGMPIVHIVVPHDMRDVNRSGVLNGKTVSYTWVNMLGGLDGIRIELPALDVQPQTPDGLFPMNIQIKDPVWRLRNMFDFSFSVKPNEARVLWLDMRDRILPNDQPLYLTLVGSGCDFSAEMLKGMKIELVFKSMDEAKKEHVADRITQIRDNHAMICEEVPRSRRLNKFNQIEADMNDLLRVDPANEQGRKYWYQYHAEQFVSTYELPSQPEGVPRWAFLQLEVLRTYNELVEWYIDNRQIENGEFGGGISDDTDIGNLFPGLVFNGCIPEKATRSLHKLLEAAYDQGLLTEGMSTIQTDGLHTYEEGTNTICQMNLLEQGNPKQVERMMEAAKSVRDKLLGVNSKGHTHFRSDYFSATKIADQGIWTWSSNREFLHLGPALMLGEMYGNKGAREYVIRFADSMLAHARKDGQDRWVLPLEINFLTDETRGWGVEYVAPILWYAWLWTGETKYLNPIAGLDFGEKAVIKDKNELMNAYCQFLQTYDLNEYIFKEGSIWTDRIYYRPELIQRSRLGGVALNRSQRFVPENPVIWSFENDSLARKVAIHVTEKTPKTLKIDFFNTENREVKVDMKGLEVLGGKWTLRQGTDRKKESKVMFGRGRKVSLKIPPFAEYQIEMNLEGRGEEYNAMTDLGIGQEDITIDEDAVNVVLHNLSGKEAPRAVVAIVDRKGKIVSQTISEPVPAPNDLMPKTVVVTLPKPAALPLEGCRIVVDPRNEISEIYEGNNFVSIKY